MKTTTQTTKQTPTVTLTFRGVVAATGGRVIRKVRVALSADRYLMIDAARSKIAALVESCIYPTWLMPEQVAAVKISRSAYSVAVNAGPDEE